MKRYLVRFMKRVVGGDGHDVELCQRWFEIDAATEADAIECAKVKFCAMESLKDWSLHADRIQVNDADFPS